MSLLCNSAVERASVPHMRNSGSKPQQDTGKRQEELRTRHAAYIYSCALEFFFNDLWEGVQAFTTVHAEVGGQLWDSVFFHHSGFRDWTPAVKSGSKYACSLTREGSRVSLYSPGGSRTRCVDQAGFKLVPILPALLSEIGIPGRVPPPQAIIFLEQFIG